MSLYQPLLHDLLVINDNLSHRMLFNLAAHGYEIPCEIVIEPQRREIAIAASTMHRLPAHRMADATAIAALSCPFDLP